MSIQNRPVRWGIIGPGRIAHRFAQDLSTIPDAALHAVASRDKARAETFASQYGATTTYNSYEDLADDPKVDAVYIATPHSYHHQHSILCLNRKKAVLCEKPFAMNLGEVQEMEETAKLNQTLLMEALWTFFLPHYRKVLDLLNEGAIGSILSVEADFGFKPEWDPGSRVFKKELGGGSLLDIGIYPIFLALTTIGMPDDLEATGTFFRNGVDSSCTMRFGYKSGAEARLYCSFLEQTPTAAVITGDRGKLTIHPKFHAPTSFTLENNSRSETFDFDVKTNGYSYEIIHFNHLIRRGHTESDIMTFNKSKQLITLLDAVREQVGLVY
ncbi:MAG: Gfo/Idh/MocA family protein [Cyclonatronaceae bacterium]